MFFEQELKRVNEIWEVRLTQLEAMLLRLYFFFYIFSAFSSPFQLNPRNPLWIKSERTLSVAWSCHGCMNRRHPLHCSSLFPKWVMAASGHSKLTHIMSLLPAIGRDSSWVQEWHCHDPKSSCPEKSSHTGLCFADQKAVLGEWLIHHSHFINSSPPSVLLLYYVPVLRKQLSLANAKANKISLSSSFLQSLSSITIGLVRNLWSPKWERDE